MKMRTGSILTVIVMCLIAVLSVGCKTAEQRLRNMIEGIRVPPETFLLASQIQETQGSQDACYFTSLFELYGSRLSIDQVFEFYSTELTHNGWAEVTPSWLSIDSKDAILFYQHENAFQIAFHEALAGEIEYLFGDIKEAEFYETSYLVTLTYADAIARRDCPSWQSESDE